MTTLREWKEKRPNYSLTETLEFSHIAFPSPYLCVKDRFSPVTISGKLYEPSSFSVLESPQDGTAAISISVTFLMGAESIRSILKKYWVCSARMSPITCTYCMWGSETDTSPMLSHTLFVKDVSTDGSNVVVTLSLTNPLTLGTDKIYRVSEYPGLKTS